MLEIATVFTGSFVIGLTLIGFAAWLHWNDTHGWPNEDFVTELDNNYHTERSKARRRIHLIIGCCGVIAVVAGVAGPASVVIWILSWLCVMIALMTVVILAGFDALRTHRYHIAKLPEIRRKHLGEDP